MYNDSTVRYLHCLKPQKGQISFLSANYWWLKSCTSCIYRQFLRMITGLYTFQMMPILFFFSAEKNRWKKHRMKGNFKPRICTLSLTTPRVTVYSHQMTKTMRQPSNLVKPMEFILVYHESRALLRHNIFSPSSHRLWALKKGCHLTR